MKFLLAVAALAALLTFVAATGSPPPASTSYLTVSLPGGVAAGEELRASVASDAPGGTSVAAVVLGAYGPVSLRSELTGGRAQLSIPEAVTRQAGRVDVVVTAAGRTATATTTIRPGPLHDPLVPLVGARSIVADGEDRAMVVVMPSDQFGNPTERRNPVQISVLHPDGVVSRHIATEERTLAWAWVPARTTAGRGTVTASSEGTTGYARDLIEIPGAAVPFDIGVETATRPADGATLVAVASEPIVDRHHNRVPDGSAVAVRAEYPGGTVAVQTVATVGGVARALIEAPQVAGAVRLTMTIGSVHSRPLDVDFFPAVGTRGIPVTAHPAPGGFRVTVGPILGVERSVVPDGTDVHITVDDPAEPVAYRVQTVGGLAAIELAEPPGTLIVVAAGDRRVTYLLEDTR